MKKLHHYTYGKTLNEQASNLTVVLAMGVLFFYENRGFLKLPKDDIFVSKCLAYRHILKTVVKVVEAKLNFFVIFLNLIQFHQFKWNPPC